MALHWVFGGSGSGKSSYVYNEITKLSKTQPDKTYIVIVPEQFTMQTQKDMVMLSEAEGIMNIDVLSFLRLAYRVLEYTPALSKTVLADEGKGMIIRRILREHEDEWCSFGKNVRKPGFVEEIKSIITEFIQYRIDGDKIDDMIASAGGKDNNLVRKLSDIRKVYEYYREFLEERYISSEEILKILADYVPESEFLRDSVICLDGFTGFTPVQYLLISELMAVCSDIYITACIDKETDPLSALKLGEIFYMSKEFIQKCNRLAAERHFEVADPVWTGTDDGTPWRFRDNKELACAEKNLFRNNKRKNVRFDSNKNIRVYKAASTEEEVDFCIWEIRNLVRKSGLRYKDIAIVTGNMEEYSRILKAEFERLDMPYFIDYNRSVIENPLVRMILLLLENAIYGFDRNRVIRLLRNGIVRDYMGFAEDRVDEIDNYVLARGVRGKSGWEKTFDGISDEAQETREKFVKVFINACRNIAEGKTADDRSRALYQFLVDNSISDIMYEMADSYSGSDPVRKKEYEQIYRIVIGMLDQMSELMGDENIALREYYDLLKTGFDEASVGVIPPGIDTIIVGDTKRTRLKDIRVLFFLGVNDGSVPVLVSEGGFLSDHDRIRLAEGGASLAPTAKEKIFNDRFYIYLNFTKPSDMLVISYAAKNLAGDDLQPSIILDELKVLYDNGLTIESEYKNSSPEAMLRNDMGRSMWINELRRFAGGSEAALTDEWLELHNKLIKEYPEIYEQAFFTGSESHIEKDVAKTIYGDEITGSVSRFELFANCPFAHFLRYGLRLQDREEFKLQTSTLGKLFHETVEIFTRRMKEEKRRWQELDEQTISDMVSDIVDERCASFGNGIMSHDARNRYMAERVKRISKRSISILAYHMKQGSFEIEDCEVLFSYNGNNAIRLDNGGKLNITGRIDRLDLCRKDDRVIYKIIDYKSGNNTFDLIDLYNGTNMQLAVYLMAAGDMEVKKENGVRAVPAGVFYFHLDDPVVTNDNYEKEILKKLKMNGIVNVDDGIPFLIDKGLAEYANANGYGLASEVINLTYENTGDIKNSGEKNNYTGKQLELIRRFVRDKMKEYACDILDGDTSIRPVRASSDRNACKYCDYKAVCQFDTRLAGNSFRKPVSKEEKDIWEEWWNRYYGVYEKPENGD